MQSRENFGIRSNKPSDWERSGKRKRHHATVGSRHDHPVHALPRHWGHHALSHSEVLHETLDWGLIAKRFLDILGSGLGLTLLSPLFLLVSLAIRLDSPGPVFFNHYRVGKDGKLFKIWKFRSMYIDAEERKKALAAQNEMAGGVLFKMKNDPRVTRVGRFIRKASIDELPQLWNVFTGDMSLVGPRPALPSEVSQYDLRARRRLEVLPGITCIWQVSGRSNIPFERQIEMDIDYIDSRSIWVDLKLLFLTVPAVLLGRGAY